VHNIVVNNKYAKWYGAVMRPYRYKGALQRYGYKLLLLLRLAV